MPGSDPLNEKMWVFRFTGYGPLTEFILKELFDNHILRQGWGAPGLDLRVCEHSWMSTYSGPRYRGRGGRYGGSPETRWGILKHMLSIRKGDIIFIPNARTGQYSANEDYFTKVTVSEPYIFQDRTGLDIDDFGHMILVTKVQSFKFHRDYSLPCPHDTLPKSIFGAPFMHAIDPVPGHPVRGAYKDFSDFIRHHIVPHHYAAYRDFVDFILRNY